TSTDDFIDTRNYFQSLRNHRTITFTNTSIYSTPSIPSAYSISPTSTSSTQTIYPTSSISITFNELSSSLRNELEKYLLLPLEDNSNPL
ncbi:27227_t:CDS:1, partial [Racocetra persica]